MSVLLFCNLLLIYIKFFNKKLVVLLSMEGALLSFIIFISILSIPSYSSSLIMILLSVFMVLDSVLGISLLICSSRFSSSNQKIL